MTTEEKYQEDYLTYVQEYGTLMTSSQYKELISKGEELGFSEENATALLTQMQSLIRKTNYLNGGHDNLKIDLTDIQQINDNPIIKPLIEDMIKYQSTINDILSNAETLSDNLTEISETINNIGEEVLNYGLSQIEDDYHSKKGLITAGLGAAAMIGGQIYTAYKKHKIEKKRKEQLAIIRQKRKAMAYEKYKNLSVILPGLDQHISKLNKSIYERDFQRQPNVEATTLNKEICSFKQEFYIYIKLKFFKEIADYILRVFDAWKQEKDEDNIPVPNRESLMDKEIYKWIELLLDGKDITYWEKYIKDIIRNPQQQYPIAIYIMFTDPYLLRNYIGINLFDISNSSHGFITNIEWEIEQKIDGPQIAEQQNICQPILQLLEKNPYYEDCRDLINNYQYQYPKKKLIDYIYAFGWTLLFIIIGILLLKWTSWWFLLVGPAYIWIISMLIMPQLIPNVPFTKATKNYYETLKYIAKSELTIATKYNEFKK